MNASDVMSSPVITVSPNTPVTDIARLLLARHIGGVPVVERENVLGFVSEADLLRLYDEGTAHGPHTWWERLMHPGALAQVRLCAADLMSHAAVSVGEYTPLADLASMFAGRQTHRVTVLSGRHLVGIITASDVMQALLTLGESPSESGCTDAAIEASLGARLEAQDWWNPMASHVSVDKGIVWFRGMVESEAARDAARHAAESTPGVFGVLDHLICAAPCEPWSSAQALEYVDG